MAVATLIHEKVGDLKMLKAKLIASEDELEFTALVNNFFADKSVSIGSVQYGTTDKKFSVLITYTEVK